MTFSYCRPHLGPRIATCTPSRFEFLDDAGAVAVAVDVDADALEHGEPDVVEWRAFVEHEVVTKLEVGGAASENGRAVREVVDRANI